MAGAMSIYEFKNLVDLRSGLENSERFYCIEYFTKKVGLMNQTPTKKSKHYSFLPMTRAGSGGL